MDKKLTDRADELDERISREVKKIIDTVNERNQLILKIIDDRRVELYEAIDQQVTKAEEQLKEEKKKIWDELGALRKEIEKHEGFNDAEKVLRKIREVDVNREEATFTFESDNITAFLDSDHKEKRASEYFYVRGIQWYLGMSRNVAAGESYLAVRLYARNPADSYTDWSIHAKFKYRVVVGEKVISLDYYDNEATFQRTEGSVDSFGGFTRALKIADLKKEKFIENDRIRLQIHLDAKPLQRQGYLADDEV